MADEKVGFEISEKGEGANALVRAVTRLAVELEKAEASANGTASATRNLGTASSQASAQVGGLASAIGRTTTGFTNMGADTAAAMGEVTGATNSARAAIDGVSSTTATAGTSIDRLNTSVRENVSYQSEFRDRIVDLNNALGTYGDGVERAATRTRTLGTEVQRQPGFFSRLSSGISGVVGTFTAFGQANEAAAAATRRASQQTDFYEKQLSGGFKDTLQNIIQNMLTLGAAFATVRTVMFTDQVNQSSEVLREFTGSIEENNKKMTELQALSNTLGVPIAQLTASYVAQERATRNLNGATGDSMVNLQNMVAISKMAGTANEDATASLKEFYAAFPNGIANTQMLLAVMDKYPATIGRAVTNGLLGARAGFMNMSQASQEAAAILQRGGVTIGTVYAGISANAASFNAEMQKQGQTVGSAFEKLVSNLQNYIANGQNATGITGGIINAFNYLADNAYLVVAALAALTAAVAIVGLAALVSAVGTLAGLLGGLVGIILASVAGAAALAAAVYVAWQAFSQWAEQYTVLAEVVNIVNTGFGVLMQAVIDLYSWIWKQVKAFAEWVAGLSQVASVIQKVKSLFDATGKTFAQVGDSMAETGVQSNGLATGIGTASNSMSRLYDTTQRGGNALTPYSSQLKSAATAADGLGTSSTQAATATSTFGSSVGTANGQLGSYVSGLGQAASSLDIYANAAKNAAAAASDFAAVAARNAQLGGQGNYTGYGAGANDNYTSFNPNYSPSGTIGGFTKDLAGTSTGGFTSWTGRGSLASGGVGLIDNTGVNAAVAGRTNRVENGQINTGLMDLAKYESQMLKLFEEYKQQFPGKSDAEYQEMIGAPVRTATDQNNYAYAGGDVGQLGYDALDARLKQLRDAIDKDIEAKKKIADDEAAAKKKEQDAKDASSGKTTAANSNQPRPIQVVINTPDYNSFRRSERQLGQNAARELQRQIGPAQRVVG